MLEILMRYYNDIEMEKNPMDPKIWFFDVEQSILINLAKLK